MSEAGTVIQLLHETPDPSKGYPETDFEDQQLYQRMLDEQKFLVMNADELITEFPRVADLMYDRVGRLRALRTVLIGMAAFEEYEKQVRNYYSDYRNTNKAVIPNFSYFYKAVAE